MRDEFADALKEFREQNPSGSKIPGVGLFAQLYATKLTPVFWDELQDKII